MSTKNQRTQGRLGAGVLRGALGLSVGLTTRLARAEETNLALGHPCQVFSSCEADGWSASKLTDGDIGALGWSSKAFAEWADHQL
jgi:hypothetical protein